MADLQRVWRDAVVHLNYHRATRVLKTCKVDRERLDLWNRWLGLEECDGDAECDGVAPDVVDVWDMVETHVG
jgi:hypothetical protein